MEYRKLAEEFFSSILSAEHAPADKPERTFPKGEFGILVYLTHHRDGASVGELTDYLRVTSGRTASTLNALERKGLVRRQTDSADNRRILVFLTDEGRGQFQAEYDRSVAGMSEFFRRLGEEDAREYMRIMKKAHRDMQARR